MIWASCHSTPSVWRRLAPRRVRNASYGSRARTRLKARSAERLARRAPAAKTQTFADAAYIRAQEPGWTTRHASEWRSTLDRYVDRIFGNLAVAAIDTGLIRRSLDQMWVERPETERRLLDRIRRFSMLVQRPGTETLPYRTRPDGRATLSC